MSDFESRKKLGVKFKLHFANNIRFRITSFTTHQILKTICFLLQIRFWRKLCFWKVNFCSFFQHKNVKPGISVLSFRERIWEKNWNGKRFLGQKNWYECVCQPIFPHLVSFGMKFLKTCQMLNQLFYNASVMKWNCVLIKSNSVAKLAFEFFFLQIYRKSLTKKLDHQTIFEWKKLLRLCLSTNFFTTLQFLKENFYNVSDVESHFYQALCFQVELCFFEIKFCCKTCFRNFFSFAKLHGKNFKVGSLMFSWREQYWEKVVE